MAGYVLAVLAAVSVAATGVSGQGEMRSSQAVPHARTGVVAVAKKGSVGECFVDVKGFKAPKLSAVRKARADRSCANLAQAQTGAAVGGAAGGGAAGMSTGALAAIGAGVAAAAAVGIAAATTGSSS